MKAKNLVVALLVVIALAVSGFTYAFWAAGVAEASQTAVGTVEVGTGNTVESTVSVGEAVNSQGANALVPAGFAEAGKIVSLTLTFSVSWASTGLDASGLSSTLTVALTDAVNSTDDDVLSLFNAAYNGLGDGTYTIVTDDSSVSVVVTITIDEPADQAEYLLIAGEDIELTFSFSVAAAA